MNNGNDAYHNNLFADSNPPYHAYDSAFLHGADQSVNNGWDVNATAPYNPNTSRAGQQIIPADWQQNANRLSPYSGQGNINGHASPYNRSLAQSPVAFGQNTIPPYQPQNNFQYQQPQYDPALLNHTTSGQASFQHGYTNYGNQVQPLSTIAPQQLQHEARVPSLNNHAREGLNYAQNAFSQSRFATANGASISEQMLVAAMPKGEIDGNHSIINFDGLVRATNSERMRAYLNVGRDTHEWPVNRTTTLPQYAPRKSKNELRKLAGNDQSLLAKIGRKSIKHTKSLATDTKIVRPFVPGKGPGSPESIKFEGDSPSSEESSDDDDDSSYTSDEAMETSPLPQKRPDYPKDAVEYDTIKALWRGKRKPVRSDEIRKGIVDFWEVVKTIRDRWKADAAAVTEAEAKKRTGELPLLNSRVKDQRDMAESAFRTALKYGHRSIVELLAENAALVYVCYQFLIDRVKADDLNSPLVRALLETMTLWTTLTTETLEKTHLDKALARYVKKADAKTKHYAKLVLSNAAAASKEKPVVDSPTKAAASKTLSPTPNREQPAPVAGVKRSAPTTGLTGGPQKKAATDAAKTNGATATSKGAAAVKKPNAGETYKPPSAAATPPVKTKVVQAKPSSLFSNLQPARRPGTSIKTGTPAMASGTAKPAEKKMTTPLPTRTPPNATFNFAQTMANLAKPKEEKAAPAKPEVILPPETAEEAAKRLRKEARRKLHVRFKVGDELEEIKYFTHDPEEEIGQGDASQMRDVKDAGGEGRMLKMHQDTMDIDEEDEFTPAAAETAEQKLVPFYSPNEIDFSVVDSEERAKNYKRYGGTTLEPESTERVAREQYDQRELIVYYATANDVPPNPREPSDPYKGEQMAEGKKSFGAVEPWLLDRGRRMRAQIDQQRRMGQPGSAGGFNLPPAGNTQYPYQFVPQPQQPPPPPVAIPQITPDIQSLIANLQQHVPNFQQQFQPPPPPPPPPPQQQQIAPMAAFPAAAPSGQPDITAILAGLQQLNAQQQQPQPQTQQGLQHFPSGGEGEKRWGVNAKKGGGRESYKTKVCRFWLEGRCMKGDGCTYLHRVVEGGEEAG